MLISDWLRMRAAFTTRLDDLWDVPDSIRGNEEPEVLDEAREHAYRHVIDVVTGALRQLPPHDQPEAAAVSVHSFLAEPGQWRDVATCSRAFGYITMPTAPRPGLWALCLAMGIDVMRPLGVDALNLQRMSAAVHERMPQWDGVTSMQTLAFTCCADQEITLVVNVRQFGEKYPPTICPGCGRVWVISRSLVAAGIGPGKRFDRYAFLSPQEAACLN